MPVVSLTADRPADVPADVLVLAVAAPPEPGGDPVLLGAEALPDGLRAALAAPVLRALGVSGRADAVARVPSAGAVPAPVVALTGVGRVREAAPDAEALRRAAGAAVRELAGAATVALALPVTSAEEAAAVAEGAALGAYAFGAYRVKEAPGDRAPVAEVAVLVPEGLADADGVADRVRVLADAVALTRDLVNTPPSDLYPASFAERAAAAVDGLPVAITVLDDAALAEGGYGGILGVGKGSERPPRLVHLEYAPEGARGSVALVGKGITFDSGGLSIKTASGMADMKSDMAGAAAVLATVVAAARLELPVRVGGWLAVAENMPSGTAQRPSDVLTTRGGRTVEVLNTDAEGRLVMADALVDASATSPDLVVDVATLTGAQVVALGNRVSAVMANDDALRERVVRAAGEAGEQVWPMPLPPELRPSLDSPVADVANIGERFGGMLVAGLFLAEFVGTREDGERIPWAHLDIAGPAFNTGSPHGYTPVGGTGVIVRTLVRLLEDVASNGA
ncbi:MAG TPA: leucyl aminopeptidase [Kineosporiaceae bacterium]|nr:leucyl aminopeptidase [Kineosporiaceae bacterium]